MTWLTRKTSEPRSRLKMSKTTTDSSTPSCSASIKLRFVAGLMSLGLATITVICTVLCWTLRKRGKKLAKQNGEFWSNLQLLAAIYQIRKIAILYGQKDSL